MFELFHLSCVYHLTSYLNNKIDQFSASSLVHSILFKFYLWNFTGHVDVVCFGICIL